MTYYALMSTEELAEAMDILAKAITEEQAKNMFSHYTQQNETVYALQKDYDKLYAVWRVK